VTELFLLIQINCFFINYVFKVFNKLNLNKRNYFRKFLTLAIVLLKIEVNLLAKRNPFFLIEEKNGVTLVKKAVLCSFQLIEVIGL
jgi:hypothetical protein